MTLSPHTSPRATAGGLNSLVVTLTAESLVPGVHYSPCGLPQNVHALNQMHCMGICTFWSKFVCPGSKGDMPQNSLESVTEEGAGGLWE